MFKPKQGRERRMKRPFAAFAFTVLALTTLAGGASATHSPGGGPANQDFTSGTAYWGEPPWHEGEPEPEKHCNPGALEPGQGCWNAQWHVDAKSDADGKNPRGHWSLQIDRQQPRGNYYARGDVICLRVIGNRAIIGGVVTEARNAESTDLKAPDDPNNVTWKNPDNPWDGEKVHDGQGSFTLFEVVDMGPNEKDKVNNWVVHGDLRANKGFPWGGPPLNTCPDTRIADTVQRGNLVVHDAKP